MSPSAIIDLFYFIFTRKMDRQMTGRKERKGGEGGREGRKGGKGGKGGRKEGMEGGKGKEGKKGKRREVGSPPRALPKTSHWSPQFSDG